MEDWKLKRVYGKGVKNIMPGDCKDKKGKGGKGVRGVRSTVRACKGSK